MVLDTESSNTEPKDVAVSSVTGTNDTWSIPSCTSVVLAMAAVNPLGFNMFIQCDEQGHVVLSDADVERIVTAIRKVWLING